MAKQNSVNLDITNNADGFSIAGGSTSRTLGVSGADITLVGSGTATLTFPTTSTTIAGLGIGQTFTAQQVFTAGITVSGGATFSTIANFISGLSSAGGTFGAVANFVSGFNATGGSTFNDAAIFVSNSSASTDPLYVQHNTASGLKVSSTGQGRQGSIRLGNSTNSSFNIYITQSDGTLTVYNGISAGLGAIMMAIGITGGVTISPTINGATFNQIIRSTSGISASGAVTGGSWIFAQEGYRVGSAAINAKTGTTYTFSAADDGEIFTSSNAATQTFTIPTGLPIGFNCTIIQIGTGGVALTGASGVTLNSYNSKYNLLGQHASASIISYTTNVFNLSGGLT